MADTKRRRVLSTKLAEDFNSATFTIHDTPAEDGSQAIHSTIAINPSDFGRWTNYFAILGFNAAAGNRYNRLDNPTGEQVAATVQKLLADVASDTWAPNTRDTSGAESEPDDIVVAIAEVTGQTVDTVQEQIDTRMQVNEDGSLRKNSKGSTLRFFNKAMLDKIAADPKVKVVLARLADERAKRLRAEAKTSKPSDGTSLLDAFGTVGTAPVAQAAE